MPYSKQDLLDAWDKQSSFDLHFTDINVSKSLNLLAKYTGSSKEFLYQGIQKFQYKRFFTGRWYTTHAVEVEDAISGFYCKQAVYYNCQTFHSIEFILALIKRKLKDTEINPNGSLAKILDVIKEKTGVDYSLVDDEAVIQRTLDAASRDVYFRLPTGEVFQFRPLTPESSSSSTLTQYSEHTQIYIKFFDNKPSFQEQFDALNLTEAEKKEVNDKFSCPISCDVMNIPVSLNEVFYDLNTLTKLERDPLTRLPFSPQQIQSARTKVDEMNAFIEKVTLRNLNCTQSSESKWHCLLKPLIILRHLLEQLVFIAGSLINFIHQLAVNVLSALFGQLSPREKSTTLSFKP